MTCKVGYSKQLVGEFPEQEIKYEYYIQWRRIDDL